MYGWNPYINPYEEDILEKIAEQELTNPKVDPLEKIAAGERLKIKASMGGMKTANAIAKMIKSLRMRPKVAQTLKDVATVALASRRK